MKKRFFLLGVAAVVLTGSLVFIVGFARPYSISDAQIKITVNGFYDDLSFKSYIRQYKDGSYVSFRNDDCTFSSMDKDDYCEVTVSAQAHNGFVFNTGFNYLYPLTANDFIIFGIIPVSTTEIKPGCSERIYSSFICQKGNMTEDEIVEQMKKMTYSIVFENSLLDDINMQTRIF